MYILPHIQTIDMDGDLHKIANIKSKVFQLLIHLKSIYLPFLTFVLSLSFLYNCIQDSAAHSNIS